MHQPNHLIGGRLRTWAGAAKTVLSPTRMRLGDGQAQQVEIVSYPLMGEAVHRAVRGRRCTFRPAP